MTDGRGQEKEGVPFYLRKADHDPRAAALSAVSRILAGGMDSQEVLDQALHSPVMMPSDKGLCTELLYGHIRMRLRLRWFSSRHLRKPEKLPWEMRLCLEQALYSMGFLRMPHRAAVHWAVDHVRHRFGPGLAGVANGALRTMQRELPYFRDYDFYLHNHESEEEALATWFSMPLWIVRLWHEAYGPEKLLGLLKISASAPPQGLRLNRSRPGWREALAGFLAYGEQLPRKDDAPSPVSSVGEGMLIFEQGMPYNAKELVQSGHASRQSAASWSVLEAFDPQHWPSPLWDCCAGRGGKTLALLEQGIGVALASDPSSRRLGALRKDYTRLGLEQSACPVLLSGSAVEGGEGFDSFRPLDQDGEIPELPEQFGAILVDAPCSGLGTMSRYPEIRLRRSVDDCADLVELQKNILDAAWRRLLPGGRLIYLTCTVNPEENEKQLARFLERHEDAVSIKEYDGGDWQRFREYFYGVMLEKKGEEQTDGDV